MENMEAKMIADTTLSQLGGSGRLSAMIGANSFSYDKDGSLSFRFKMCKKANAIRITLNAKDLYDIKFFKIGKYDFKEVKVFEDIYNDQLKSVIEEYTGLYLSL